MVYSSHVLEISLGREHWYVIGGMKNNSGSGFCPCIHFDYILFLVLSSGGCVL